MKIETQIQIHASLENVYGVFSDLDNLEERIKGIDKVEILHGPANMEKGTKWKETRTMFGKEAKEVMWVTELNPMKNYVVEAESHGTHYRSEYIFSENDGITLVQMSFEGIPLSFTARLMSFMFIFFAKATKKMLLQDMKDLAKVCEGL